MRKIVQALCLPGLVVGAVVAIAYRQAYLIPTNPPGYLEAIKGHATGPTAEEAIFLLGDDLTSIESY